MRFRRRRRAPVGIELVNLVDVVVLILIFFMVATTFSKDGRLKLVLPEAETRATDAEPERLELVISERGEYALNGHVLAGDGVEAIMDALRERSGDGDKPPLVVSADARTAHASVVRALDAAGRLGFSQVRITTRPPKGDTP